MTNKLLCEYINNIIRFKNGKKNYLLENEEDYEEIKKLNMNQDFEMVMSDKKINQ